MVLYQKLKKPRKRGFLLLMQQSVNSLHPDNQQYQGWR